MPVSICLTSFPSGYQLSCTNNNYASREKCGQPKEVAAMPLIATTGASFPTYSQYFSGVSGGPAQKMNIGLIGIAAPPQSLPFFIFHLACGSGRYVWHSASFHMAIGSNSCRLPHESFNNQNLSVLKGWCNGDWMYKSGFHNYSSLSQCKKCNAFAPALGTKQITF